MKVVSSLKSHKKRDLNSKLVRRRGRVYIINKKNKGYRNKGPRYFEKLGHFKKKLKNFFIKESKRKLSRRMNHGQK